MLNFYLINGYFNSDHSEFFNRIVCEQEVELPDGVSAEEFFGDQQFNDDEIFFFGLSRHEAEELIKEDQKDNEFTITAVFDA